MNIEAKRRILKAKARCFLSSLGAALCDDAMIFLAYLAAIAFRFDFGEPRWGWYTALCWYAISCVVFTITAICWRCYKVPWMRFDFRQIFSLVGAMTTTCGILVIMRFVLSSENFSAWRPPYSIVFMACFLSITGMIAVRLLYKAYWRSCSFKNREILERDERQFDNTLAAKFIAGKVVMVTGAGGSIGSEIVRQTVSAGAKRVLLVERSENALYEIDRHIRATGATNIEPIMLDAGDVDKMRAVFERFHPEIVLHVAAYKHVPLVECNPEAGFENNTLASENLARLSKEAKVERFVLISTDKAVNPLSVMGKTKRAAEKAVMALNEDGATSFCAVRFGNVYGSSGSVVPLFREQIAALKPITITHPDMKRYFMTIREAVSLVLQAASRSERAIYTLDMGEPVKIVDLAEEMVRQAGLRPYIDIPIVYTGIRPGEKLFEQLDISERSAYKTDMAKIYITICR